MHLIIKDELIVPPSSVTCVRDVTFYFYEYKFFRQAIIVETNDADFYYPWMKKHGLMDYVEELVPIGREDGLRLDTEHNFPRTVVIDRVVPENLHYIISQIQMAKYNYAA